MGLLATLRHAVHVAHGAIREAAKGRSPHWPAVRFLFLASHPTCAACGGAARLQVHHCVPFHRDPALELDPANLITLCMGVLECHLKIGHGDDFETYNPDVRAQAAEALANPHLRPSIMTRAKLGRRK